MSSLYENFAESIGITDDEILGILRSIIVSGSNTISLNHKMMKKNVDVSWVDAIEEGMKHVDNVLRKPSRTIEDIETIVPIALSRKITVESVKHLAQHTDLIQDYDPVTKRVTPSKVLNVYKEDSMMTYENKFVNTLIDRLYIFISRRYEKLKEVAKDESSFIMDYKAVCNQDNGKSMKLNIILETKDNLEITAESAGSVWDRIERIKNTVESYKNSSFCKAMGKAYIRPPVMRTNAILKNVDMKACLVLWQFIEGYDKIGYDMVISNTAQKPSESFVGDFYTLSALTMLAFRSHTSTTDDFSDLKVKNTYYAPPKIVKKFNNEMASELDMEIEVGGGGGGNNGEYVPSNELPPDAEQIADEIDKIIETELAFFKSEAEKEMIERQKLEELKRQHEEEQRKLEEERRQIAIQEEKERREREEKERERLLEQRRKEQEEEERLAQEEAARKAREQIEQEKLEQERLEQERLEQERLEREEQERLAREEQARIEHERAVAEAEQAQEETEEERLQREKEEEEFAAEQAARYEREQRETRRAVRLRTERKILEKKPFEVIYFEYSREPHIVIARTARNILRQMGFFAIDRDSLSDEELGILEIEERCNAFAETEKEMKRLEREQNGFIHNLMEKLEDFFGEKSAKNDKKDSSNNNKNT